MILEMAWLTYQSSVKEKQRGRNIKISYELDQLDRSDWLNAEEQKDYLKESKETNKAGKQIDVFEKILAINPEKWHHLSLFKKDQGYKESDAEVSLPKLMNLVVTNKLPTDKQFLKALSIMEEAEENDSLIFKIRNIN